MREIKLEVLDSNDTYLGDIELENFKDFPLSLTKAIGDINSLTKRQAVYSLDFDIPVTQNNNKLLFGASYVNASGDSLKSLSRNKCRVLVDGNQTEYGFIRVLEHSVNDTYKATFTGGNGDWVDLLANTYLNELEWVSETNSGTTSATETFSSARINAVNNLDSNNVDIVYPYIERDVVNPAGTESLRPTLYLRSVLKRMFEKIGYTITGNWIDSEELNPNDGTHKGVVVDPAFKFFNDDDTVQGTFLEATTTTSSLVNANAIGWDGSAIVTQSKYAGYFDDEVADNGNYFTPSTSIYSVNTSGTYLIRFEPANWRYYFDRDNNGTFIFLAGNPPSSIIPPTVKYYLVKNNTSSTVIDGTIIFESAATNNPSNLTEQVALFSGDELTLWIEIQDNASVQAGVWGSHLNAPSLDKWQWFIGWDNTDKPNLKIQLDSQIDLGQEYNINAQIGEKLNCLDLLQDIKTMYNLYFSTNFQSKEVSIEPRDDFYQNIGDSENITDLIDLSKPIIINSEKVYKQQLRFRYKEDSKDGYLSRWNAINNRTYAEYTHNFGDNYERGVDIIETKLISPTIQKAIDPTDRNIASSVIRREYEDSEEPDNINEEYNVRVFYVEKSEQYNTDGTPRRQSGVLNVTSAMMESFGNVTTYNSNQLTFNGTNGLFARYYAKTIANIQDVRKVELYLKLPLYKFKNLDLSKPVYIDWSVANIQGYYIIEEVKNYKLESFETVKVRLLRFKNYDAVTVDSSQKTNINENTATGQTGDAPEPIYYIFDEGTANENYEIVYDIQNGTGNLEPLYYE
jgi:hypothetical protein